MVFATLEGIFLLLDLSENWDFVINLSASDYPLCSDAELSLRLENNVENNFDIGKIPIREDEKYWYAILVV